MKLVGASNATIHMQETELRRALVLSEAKEECEQLMGAVSRQVGMKAI